MISVTLYNDPACPWAYSERPALRVLEWRYGAPASVAAGADRSDRERCPVRGARIHAGARRAQPAALPPLRDAVRARAEAPVERDRARLPGRRRRAADRAGQRVRRVPRAPAGELHDADACSTTTRQLRRGARGACPASTPSGSSAMLDCAGGDRGLRARPRRGAHRGRLAGRAAGQDREHRRSRALHRARRSCSSPTASGSSPAAFSPSRPTTCWSRTSIRRSSAGRRRRRPAPLLEHFREGLTTQEVAALLARGNDAPDQVAAEAALIELVADGQGGAHGRSATTRCGCAVGAVGVAPRL